MHVGLDTFGGFLLDAPLFVTVHRKAEPPTRAYAAQLKENSGNDVGAPTGGGWHRRQLYPGNFKFDFSLPDMEYQACAMMYCSGCFGVLYMVVVMLVSVGDF